VANEAARAARGLATRADADHDRVDWSHVERELDAEGFAALPGYFDEAQVRALRSAFDARARGATLFDDAPGGTGVVACLDASCPGLLGQARDELARRLAPIAARWRGFLQGDAGDPATASIEEAGVAASPAPHAIADAACACSHLCLLRVGERRFLQAVAPQVAIDEPFLLVALLSEPGSEFTGGELVMTERRPRMQSRPIVLPLARGDAVLVAAGPRPCRGAHGTYRAHLRQAVSRVRSGERLGLWLRVGGA
jgi:hypothetical protein